MDRESIYLEAKRVMKEFLPLLRQTRDIHLVYGVKKKAYGCKLKIDIWTELNCIVQHATMKIENEKDLVALLDYMDVQFSVWPQKATEFC